MHHSEINITAADLFCGAGGTSAGLLAAAKKLGINVNLFALNHWQVAITTHQLNHPQVRHAWADIEGIDPQRMIPGGKLDVLVASPSCTHHSRARGGKPVSDQKRSSADYVTQWAEELHPRDILIENVPEFADWGPLYPDDYPVVKLRNTPIPDRKGEQFNAFVSDLQALGYQTEWRILNAADYGDATSRKRFFLRASHGKIVWPTPSHPRSSWRPAREIIDFSVTGQSNCWSLSGRST